MNTALLIILILGCLAYFFTRFVVFVVGVTLKTLAKNPKETLDKILSDKKHYGYLSNCDKYTVLEPHVIYNLKFIHIFYTYLETQVAFDIFSKKKMNDVRDDLTNHLINVWEENYLDTPLLQLAKECGKFHEEYLK